MKISNIVNEYAKNTSPYIGEFVNHLPMGQLALYFMTDSLERVKEYSEDSNLDPIKETDTKVESIDEALGKRDLYKSLLEFFNKNINSSNIDEYIKKVLNSYPKGMSSGLFHTTIRLAYAVEGYEVDDGYIDELCRALAYYVTGYREGGLFTRKIDPKEIIKEMEKLKKDPFINDTIKNEKSLGQKMKTLYENEEYMEKGFLLEGSKDEKIKGLLDLTTTAFVNSKGKGDILILHCITGLHALVVLEKYFEDFENALDILTTFIITHLMTLDDLNLVEIKEESQKSFEEIIPIGAESSDVHTIKLTYSASELFNKFHVEKLTNVGDKRVTFG